MKTLQEILGEELYAQVKVKLDENSDLTVLVDTKKEPSYIPKERFDEVNNQRKEYKQQATNLVTQLDGLKESAKGNEKLQAELEGMKAKIQDYEGKIVETRKEAKLEMALKDAKAKNPKLVKALLDLTKIQLNDAGELDGIADQLKSIKEAEAYLFQEDKPTEPTPPTGGTGNIGSKGKGSEGDKPVETIGSKLAKQKATANANSNPSGFFSI